MRLAALLVLTVFALAPPAGAAERLTLPWPNGDTIRGIDGQEVSFPTSDPFVLSDARRKEAPPRTAKAQLFLPSGLGNGEKVPAVIMLHGAGGVIWNRELTYGRQYAAMGVAALVIDAFGARRDLATGFIDRLLNITETMLIADAYAGLRYLAARGDIDTAHVALIGFSYGAMATVFSAYVQVADVLAPNGLRFAGHVAYYGPCLGRFDDTRTTGAPVMMLAGTRDAIVDRARCEDVAADLREGGSEVVLRWYEGAWHQWDGAFTGPRPIGRNLAPCKLEVDHGGRVWDARTGLPMMGPFTRKVILGLCVGDEGYLIGRDDETRRKSNADVGAFLRRVLAR